MSPEEAFMADYLAETQPARGMAPDYRVHRGAVIQVSTNSRSGGIYIDLILAVNKRLGAGSNALRFLCRLADKHQVALSGRVMQITYGSQRDLGARGRGMDVDDLSAWYTGFGFSVQGTGTIRGMHRSPTPLDRCESCPGLAPCRKPGADCLHRLKR